jgi:hypothetical protein
MTKLDPKTKNLFIFVFKWVFGIGISIYSYIYFTSEYRFYAIIGHLISILIIWRLLLNFYRYIILKPKSLNDCGKWVIFIKSNDSSSLSKLFIDELIDSGKSVCLVSTTNQSTNKTELSQITAFQHTTSFLISEKNNLENQIKEFSKLCEDYQNDGGIGMVINDMNIIDHKNKSLLDINTFEINKLLRETIYSTTILTTVIFPYLKLNSGVYLNISSKSGAYCNPYNALPSSLM